MSQELEGRTIQPGRAQPLMDPKADERREREAQARIDRFAERIKQIAASDSAILDRLG